MQHMHMMPVMPHDEEDMDKRKTPSSWDPHDDLLLRHLKETLKLGWKEIASHFPNRTPNACQFRWRRLISGTLRTPQPLLTLIPLDQQQGQGQGQAQGGPQGQPGQMAQMQSQMQPQMQQRPPLQQGHPHPHAQMGPGPQGHPQHAHHMPQQQYPYPYGYPVTYGQGQTQGQGLPPQGPQGSQGPQGAPQAQGLPPQQVPQPHPQAQAQHPHQQPAQSHQTHPQGQQTHAQGHPQPQPPQLHMPHMQQPPYRRPSLSPEQVQSVKQEGQMSSAPAPVEPATSTPTLQLPPLRSVASPPTSPLQPLSNLPPKHAPWSKEEDDLLVSRKDLDVVELSVLLPNRLSQQIRSRLSYLNSDPTLCSPPLGTVTLPPIIPATDVAGVKVQEVPVSVSDTYFPSSFMRSKGSAASGIGGVAALSAAASLASAASSAAHTPSQGGSPAAGHRPAPSDRPAFSPPSKRTKLDIPPSTQPKLQAKLITELEKSKSPQTLGSLSNLSSPLSSTSSPGTGMISPAINLPTPITSGSNKPGASTLPNKRLLGLGTPHYFPSPRTSTPKSTSGNCYFDK